MYFVEIDVIFFARLYCMISKWSVDKKKKKEKNKLKRQKRSGKKNKNSRYVSFIFLETNLCMPIRVEHFDSFTHVQMFVVFRSDRVESWSAGQKWTKRLISTSQLDEYFVIKLSNHPRADTK